MNGWMDECMDGWMEGWIDEWMDECMYGWMNVWMDECMDGCGWIDGLVDWMDEIDDEKMNG